MGLISTSTPCSWVGLHDQGADVRSDLEHDELGMFAGGVGLSRVVGIVRMVRMVMRVHVIAV